MTTVVAVKTAKGAKFAWDSQSTWQGRAILGKEKVVQNGPVTFGVAGLGRITGILKHMDIPDRNEFHPNFDNERWIITSLVPAIRRAIQNEDVSEPGSFDSDAHIVLFVGGDLGYLTSNLSYVTDETDTYAIGSGSPYALGALSAGVSAKRAVEIATQWDLYSGGTVKEMNV